MRREGVNESSKGDLASRGDKNSDGTGELRASRVPIVILAADLGQHPDRELIEAVLRRDRKATAELVQRFSGPVYAYVRSRLHPRMDLVEDLVQDVFVATWQYLPAFRGASSLGSWIQGIARHKLEDHYRRRLRQHEQWDEEVQGEPEDESPPLDDVLDRQRMTERMGEVLRELPEHYSAILLWRYWERRSAREIAESLGRTEKAVERMLAKARAQFKRRWQDA